MKKYNYDSAKFGYKTKTQRLLVYKEMLEIIKSIPAPNDMTDLYDCASKQINFCRALNLVNKLYYMDRFPELLKLKPKKCWTHNPLYWWHPCDRIRIDLLEKVIYKMETPWYKQIFNL